MALLPAHSAEPPPKSNRAAMTVGLDEQSVKNIGIETVEAEETDFEETVFTLGRIEVLPGNSAVVSTRISGRAKSVIGKAEMKCEAGDELLWVESRQPGDPPPVVRVDAPISGIVAKVNVAQGQPVGPDDSLMEIYDLSAVEAAAAVPEHRRKVAQRGSGARGAGKPGHAAKIGLAAANRQPAARRPGG